MAARKPETKTAAEDIARPLERLSRLLRAREHASDLNPAQWEALRYLARANRFSNSPLAVAQFLGTTKGTMSQTIKALERKGYVLKSPREEEKRSVSLFLTEKGAQALAQDPSLLALSVLDKVPERKKKRLAKGLKNLLALTLGAEQQPGFGSCKSCVHFVKHNADERGDLPDFECRHFKAALVESELKLMCQAQESVKA